MPQPDFLELLNHLYQPGDRDVPEHLSFGEYMDRCMFGPHGYYQTGRVGFGLGEDFWTFPARMSPLYGRMIAYRVLDLWRASKARRSGATEVFHIVEVGGGKGDLLVDTVAELALMATTDDDAAELVDCCQAIAVDRSAALLGDQAHRRSALPIRPIEAGAGQLHRVLHVPFDGVIFANELFDVLAVELVRVDPRGAQRLSVLPWVAGDLEDLGDHEVTSPVPSGLEGYLPLRASRLDRLFGRLQADPVLMKRAADREILRWSGTLVPIDDSAPPELREYLEWSSKTLTAAVEQHTEPIWVTFPPTLPHVLAAVAEVLKTGAGAFLTVDYGGISRHVFDNLSALPHLRTFNADLDPADTGAPDRHSAEKVHDPFQAPGCEDITHDIDFTWVANTFEGAGLGVAYYGHQSALESGLDLWAKPHQSELIRGRISEGYDGVQAVQQAHYLLSRFRYGGGFHLLIVTSPGLERAFSSLGPSDPIEQPVDLIPPDLERARFREALAGALRADGVDASRIEQLVERIDSAVHPTGSVVDDLCDVGCYRYRGIVMKVFSGLKSWL